MSEVIATLNSALDGRYRVERELGRGGMATVFLAEDLKHERKVALKVLKPELAAAVGAERFLAEVKTTANLQHPHILPLHDSGEADGLLFYVMPYVKGESLRERLDRERQLPVDDAVAMATKVAGALQAAHEAGVVHRDIKPANILLSEGGEPLVADFGIALAVSVGGGGRLTETGLSLGTPQYMSPEQAMGDRSIGPAADIYALGCVVYEMLAGEPPFTGNTPQALLGRIITGEVEPISARRRTVPPNVDAAVETALEKVPADRFRTADAFAEALRSPGFGADQRRSGFERPTPRRATLAAYIATAAALGAVLTWWIADSRETASMPLPSPMRFTAQLPPGEGLTGPNQLRLSSDGSMLVYTGPAEDDGEWQLWVHRWSTGTGEPIPNTAGVGFFDPSPDNDEVAVISGSSLRVQAIESERTRALADSVYCCVTWSEDDWLYYTDSRGAARRVSPGGGEPEILATADGVDHLWPSPIPGTNLMIFQRAQEGSRITLLDLDTDEVRDVSEGTRPLPFGDLILFSTGGFRKQLRYFEGLEGEAVATTIETELTSRIVPNERGAALDAEAFDASPAGHLVYSTALPSFARLGTPVQVTRDGSETPIDPTLVRPFIQVRTSPNDARLLLTEVVESGVTSIHLKELPDGPLVRITPEDELSRRASWARDGSAVYYSTIVSSGDTIMPGTRRVRPDGATEPEDVGLPQPEAIMTPDEEWWIYRTRNDIGDADLMAVRTDLASEPVTLVATEAQETQPTVSRDGRWFAYSSDRTGVREVYVRPFPESQAAREQITANGGLSPLFSPATDELFVVEGDSLVAYAYETDGGFQVAGREPLFDVSAYAVGDGSTIHHYDVTSDARTFLMIRRVEQIDDAPSTLELRLNYLRALRRAPR